MTARRRVHGFETHSLLITKGSLATVGEIPFSIYEDGVAVGGFFKNAMVMDMIIRGIKTAMMR